MADAFTDRLGLNAQEVGAHTNDWGTYLNLNLQRLDSAARGYISIAGATQTLDSDDLTTTGTVAQQNSFFKFIEFTGTPGATVVTVPAEDIMWTIYNNTDGIITFTPLAGTGVAIPVGKIATLVYGSNGTTMVDMSGGPLNATTGAFSGALTFDNDQKLTWKTAAAASRSIMYLDTGDDLIIGNTGAGDGNDRTLFSTESNANTLILDGGNATFAGNVNIPSTSTFSWGDANERIVADNAGTMNIIVDSVTALSFDASQNSTFAGRMSLNDTTESTSGITGSIHTDGGLGVVKDIIAGADLKVTGDITVDSIVQPKVKIVDIGDWDMSTATGSTQATIAHGLTLTTIRAVHVTIRSDVDTQYYDFAAQHHSSNTGPHVINLNGTNVVLTRQSGGTFDDTAFDSTSYNRGWITITYV